MFVKSTASKVKFVDQQIDDYVLENSVLKSKLHSKLEALSILSRELDKCAMERDRYRLLVEQLSNKTLPGAGRGAPRGRLSGGELLASTRDQNSQLKLEVETLRARCEEATRDVEALRRQMRLAGAAGAAVGGDAAPSHEHLVQQLEKLKNKHQQLQQDLGASLDVREELAADRDYYKGKVRQLSSLLAAGGAGGGRGRGDGEPAATGADAEAEFAENKYLQELLAQAHVEREILKQSLRMYKNMLENRNKMTAFNFNNGYIDAMTQQQVRGYLEKSVTGSAARRTHVSELKALCLGLFETLSDKSIALQHQRKTNRLLASRITELEKTLESWSNGEKYIPVFPSQMLLQEFCPESELAQGRIDAAAAKRAAESPNTRSESTDSEEDATGRYSRARTCHIEVKSSCSDESRSEGGSVRGGKTVLPPELEELVREALEQLRPC